MGHRAARLESQIKDELSLIVLHKMQDSAFGLVTITGVKLSPDLKIAKVYISVYEKSNRPVVLEKFEASRGMIRTELAHKIRVRFVPDLKFFIDDTQDYVEKIDSLLKQIHESDNKRERE
ncbi:MAG: 30S ribosome-binding factor RbfA [Ignavibacteriaceae bacterium]|nr:30S ribosome-binding factor RbfA [Ignavibacteriaceae bacterium]